ncbi:MAG: flagellar hook-basal body complex protein FliE [Deltaproteobacteria bacterium]|nr:flagellar hook-basal body complex protein FliE [Deltaproteobacteria bacterium]
MLIKAPAFTEVRPPVIDRPQDAAAGGPSFAQELRALEEGQARAEGEAVKLARGEGNLHTAALAVEQADIAMKLAIKVRNKAVEAYNDVMRMSV